MKYRLNSTEQETIIRYSRDESSATVYTSDRLVMARLDKLTQQFPDDYKCIWSDPQILGDGLSMGKKYTLTNKKRVRFTKPASRAQRAAGKANLAKINSKA